MPETEKIVISASRRTDIPAFYMEWFMDRIEKGYFEVTNPFNRKVSIVDARQEKVHTLVFWSKNFGPFLYGEFGDMLKRAGYNLFFNFTVNSDSALLEPNVPPLAERLDQMESLCRLFGSHSVTWRFDPICFYRSADGGIQDNLNDFSHIADRAFTCGIRRCITSFMDNYAKIQKRIAAISGFSFLDPPVAQKKEVVLSMEKDLGFRQIRLETCCEKELLESLPEYSSVARSSCIPNDLLVKMYGGRLSLKRDAGQRVKNGCGCKVSVDIGSYHLHPCYHNCLFCYANPAVRQNRGTG